MTTTLVLGPLVRHVDEGTAAIWVQTSDTAEVTIRLEDDERHWSAQTFAVHGHHYALVEVTGLAAGTDAAYRVELDGAPAWPLPAGERVGPPSRLRTLRPGDSLRMAFGSCRTSVPHDALGHRRHGIDALRTYGIALAESPTAPAWPELMLLLGDQIYADETSEAMRDFIASRRSLEEPPGEELKDFAEYAHLYTLAWGEPWLRWLFSCLPTLMIFDDHDVRDDWNTSWQWREHMQTLPWWHGRIVAALASYWVYQHLGNLSVDERSKDEIWQVLRERQAQSSDEVDLSELLDEFAARVDQEPQTYRWSFARDVGDSKLVVIDSRAARVLEPGHRTMLDEPEMKWLDEQVRGGHRHVFIGTSLPFLLPPGLHHLEAWNEALAAGGWGRRAARISEKLRWEIDLEHWAAFQDGFQRVCHMVSEVARGRRGPAPATVTFLSGDVHHSYVAEVEGHREGRSRILQLVCSPIRNPLPRAIRAATAILAHRVARSLGAFVARTANAPEPPWQWNTIEGPWYDNNLAILEARGDQLEVTWWCGQLQGEEEYPRLAEVARFAPVPVRTRSSLPPASAEHLRRRRRARGAAGP